jgi:dienelactone hydrolase
MPDITLPGGLKAHLAVPAVGDGPWPGVVVLHESFGLGADIRQQAGRLAAAGYLALAPDLYSAGGYWRCMRATFRSLTAGHGKAFDDIEAARRWLEDRPDCTGRVGVIGFCMGGGFALATAARGFDASAPNYAHLPLLRGTRARLTIRSARAAPITTGMPPDEARAELLPCAGTRFDPAVVDAFLTTLAPPASRRRPVRAAAVSRPARSGTARPRPAGSRAATTARPRPAPNTAR